MNLDVVLTPSGIDKAIKKLDKYKDELTQKLYTFCNRLAQEGYRIVQREKATQGDSDTSFTPTVTIDSGVKSCKATLSISGKDVLFVEFGSGVYYNGSLGSSPNPKGGEFGYFIGSYPNQTHAGDRTWFYKDSNGVRKRSHGTKASMPMYKASQYMRGHFAEIAREVFGSNG